MPGQEDVSISFTADEALVLSALLSRWERDGQVSAPRNKAEQVVLWNLTASFDPLVDVVFDPDYDKYLTAAQARLGAER